MALFDFLRRKKPPADPLAVYDAQVDALAERAQLLRRSAATLLAVRRDLDRKLAGLDQRARDATDQRDRALKAGDPEATRVLGEDLQRLERDRAPLLEQRERVARDAEDLASAVQRVEAESETLQRERDGARVALAAGQAVLGARGALVDDAHAQLRLDQARDEVERAHALAEIYREDALRRGGRERA